MRKIANDTEWQDYLAGVRRRCRGALAWPPRPTDYPFLVEGVLIERNGQREVQHTFVTQADALSLLTQSAPLLAPNSTADVLAASENLFVRALHIRAAEIAEGQHTESDGFRAILDYVRAAKDQPQPTPPVLALTAELAKSQQLLADLRTIMLDGQTPDTVQRAGPETLRSMIGLIDARLAPGNPAAMGNPKASRPRSLPGLLDIDLDADEEEA